MEFSTHQIELVNDGSERQRRSYQLQNRGPNSLRVRTAIAADSDQVSHGVSSCRLFFAKAMHHKLICCCAAGYIRLTYIQLLLTLRGCVVCVCVCVCVGVSSAEWERGEVRGSRPEAACRVAVFTSYRRSSLHHSQRPPGGVCECRSQPHHTITA